MIVLFSVFFVESLRSVQICVRAMLRYTCTYDNVALYVTINRKSWENIKGLSIRIKSGEPGFFGFSVPEGLVESFASPKA